MTGSDTDADLGRSRDGDDYRLRDGRAVVEADSDSKLECWRPAGGFLFRSKKRTKESTATGQEAILAWKKSEVEKIRKSVEQVE